MMKMRKYREMILLLILIIIMPTVNYAAESKSQQPSVEYKAHVQRYGWQDWVENGAMAGTECNSKRLEAIIIRIKNDNKLGVTYRTHIQGIGWGEWVKDGAVSGTTGQSKRVEAIQIKLTGTNASKYDIYYVAHVQTYGWLDWAKNGDVSGTTGLSKRLEAIEIRIVRKGEKLQSKSNSPAYLTLTDMDWSSKENRKKYNIVEVQKSQFKEIVSYNYPSDYKNPVLQGFCITDKHYVFAIINNGGEYSHIWFADKNNPSKILKKLRLNYAGHMNDLTYNPKTKLITTSEDDAGKITIINDETMSVKSRISSKTLTTGGIAYNKKTDQYVIKTGSSLKITDKNYNVNLINNKVFPYQQKSAPFLVSQGICTDGKYIYDVRWEPGCYQTWLQNIYWNSKQKNSNIISVYNYSGNCIKNIFIPNTIISAEFESCDIDSNGDIIVALATKDGTNKIKLAKIIMKDIK